MPREIRVRPLTAEIRTADDGAEYIEGYVVQFGKLSERLWGFYEEVRKGAFTRTLTEQKERIKALWNHNSDLVIGSMRSGSLELYEDEKGLRFRLKPNKSRAGQDAIEMVRAGDVDGVSFGFDVKKQEWDESNPNKVVRTLVDVDLWEISPTPFPAYPDSEVAARSSEGGFNAYEEYRNQKDDDVSKRWMEAQEDELRLLELEVEV
jgi:hypothetical protein